MDKDDKYFEQYKSDVQRYYGEPYGSIDIDRQVVFLQIWLIGFESGRIAGLDACMELCDKVSNGLYLYRDGAMMCKQEIKALKGMG